MDAPYAFADMPRDIAIALSREESRFVQEYIVDLNAGEAARRAEVYRGKVPTPKNLALCGEKYLKRQHVRIALHWLQSYRARNAEINAERVMQRLWAIATGDHTELTAVHVYCCRHCYGEDFQYQWINEAEFRFTKARLLMSDDAGGYGYNPDIRPNAACPHCKGLGERAVRLTDTRDYSEQAKLLYAGAKQTRSGIEVMTHDSMKALDMVTKILGMYNDTDPNENQVKIIVEGGLPD